MLHKKWPERDTMPASQAGQGMDIADHFLPAGINKEQRFKNAAWT